MHKGKGKGTGVGLPKGGKSKGRERVTEWGVSTGKGSGPAKQKMEGKGRKATGQEQTTGGRGKPQGNSGGTPHAVSRRPREEDKEADQGCRKKVNFRVTFRQEGLGQRFDRLSKAETPGTRENEEAQRQPKEGVGDAEWVSGHEGEEGPSEPAMPVDLCLDRILEGADGSTSSSESD